MVFDRALGSCDFFFNDTATTEIYTLSLHDALPSSPPPRASPARRGTCRTAGWRSSSKGRRTRSEEHTFELQSRSDLVCRLLLEKKKTTSNYTNIEKIKTLTIKSHNKQK